MIKLTQEQIERLEEILNRNDYALNYYKECLLAEDFKELHDGKEPDIVDAIHCVFVASGRYINHQDITYFSVEHTSKYGYDYCINCRKCDDMTQETFNHIKEVTLSVLENLQQNYVVKGVLNNEI